MNFKKDILLHICCGPCANRSFKYLTSKYNVIGFFYNPNIHPYREFALRLQTLESMSKTLHLDIIYDKNYYLEEFLENIASTEENRCKVCYRLRLNETAKKAKEIGAAAFTTTLLISPYQQRENIILEGQKASHLWGIPFIEADFRPEFSETKRKARELKLYLQGYCGCIFSEKERYYKDIQHQLISRK